MREHKKIAIKYFKSGWLVLDFVATFPFDLVFKDAQTQYTRMIRLLRLSKLMAILDTSRFKRIIKSYYENSTRADRFQSLYIVMYTYKIFRLIVIIFMITYFIGCFWYTITRYVNTEADIAEGNSFIKYFQLDMLFENHECQQLKCISDGSDPKCSDEEWLKENCKESFVREAALAEARTPPEPLSS